MRRRALTRELVAIASGLPRRAVTACPSRSQVALLESALRHASRVRDDAEERVAERDAVVMSLRGKLEEAARDAGE